MGLAGAEVIDKRIEEIENSSWSLYDVVTARAFATMGAALAAGAPFLRTGGLMVLSRGPEETISEKEFRNTGVHVEKKIELMLPHSDYKRAIWVFKKT
ncbi:MAG TPA: RsmG family class I SAM-dependent methyltransferase [Nitrospirota bacterium]|nr:RsmG family class I SAM-dependent methyltransferase [Nitrospirota bacterium]